MVTYDELNQQNDKITELTNVLEQLLGDRHLCSSTVTCELFFRFVEEVKGHLEVMDKGLYSQLLTHHDQHVRNTADRFMGGSKEIKRIFSAYLKKWCKMKSQQLAVKEYDQFKAETDEMFELVLNRIQAEQENLYPMIRKVTGDAQRAVA
jgi:succinate dehydrogenase flavin-adding protein (antitoxin of CptAB toxin-antitoxin module)